ncbi:DUF2837 family protein [bacterium]|jgi:hypothetical protein|nr:DUF2837 family protein [bacterium]
MDALAIVCFFTFTIHLTESLAYGMRISAVRTRQIAIAMSFVTSTLLVSRMSNLVQAPILGVMTDTAILGGMETVKLLEQKLRFVILSACVGTGLGIILTPSFIKLFQVAIHRFANHGSMLKLVGYALKPSSLFKIIKMLELPKFSFFKMLSLKGIPKTFLWLNVIVTAFYTLGVLCALMAGAYMPEYRSTAIQLSGIVNGVATIFMTLFVDPSGARITDQAVHDKRDPVDVERVVFFLQFGKLVGTGILAQLLFIPLTSYVLWVTQWLAALTG